MFKNPVNLKCINLMLTNGQFSFQTSCVIDPGLSDSHEMTVTVLKIVFPKGGKQNSNESGL